MSTIRIKVRKEVVLCEKCKKPKVFYYLSDFSYGEKLILINDGIDYAYVNLFEDEVFDEFTLLVNQILKDYHKELSEVKIIETINCIFGVSCDYIDNKVVDSSVNDEKCTNCGSKKFEANLIEPEELVNIVVPQITHETWKTLSEDEKKKKIKQEIKRTNVFNDF